MGERRRGRGGKRGRVRRRGGGKWKEGGRDLRKVIIPISGGCSVGRAPPVRNHK